MKSCWERWQTAEPPKKLTLRKAVADVIVFAVVFGVCGLITGDWDGAIGGGVSAGGGQPAVPVVERPHRPARVRRGRQR